ncbi:MAG: class I SAM-dependent methyltransferase [Gammaproteobacteria bacterium]
MTLTTDNQKHRGSEKSLTDKAYWNAVWAHSDVSRLSSRQRWRTIALGRLVQKVAGHRYCPRRILEVGVGPGALLAQLGDSINAGEVYGIDISEVACQRAVTTLRQTGRPSFVLHGLADDLPFASNAFDIVISQGLIEHFVEPTVILVELARVVAPNGIIVTTVPNIAGRYGQFLREFDPETYALHVPVTLNDLDKMHKGVGLTTKMLTPFGGSSPTRLYRGLLGRMARRIHNDMVGIALRYDFSRADEFRSAELLYVGTKT